MPRRKYGHMVGACPPTPQEKCRACRLGNPCPVHREQKPDFKALAKIKRRKFSGRKKGKKRQSKGSKQKEKREEIQ
jgi:hypothetical protein